MNTTKTSPQAQGAGQASQAKPKAVGKTHIITNELEDKILAKLSIEDEKDGIISEEEKRELLDAS